MSDSMLGKTIYVCDCGPKCSCQYRAWFPSSCPCNEGARPAVARVVLAEDLDHFYVSQTGEDREAETELGSKPLTSASGRVLQRFEKRTGCSTKTYAGHEIEFRPGQSASTIEIGGQRFHTFEDEDGDTWGVHQARRYETAEHFARALVDTADRPLTLAFPRRRP